MAKNDGLHPVVADEETFKGSGREVGQVKPPIVSINPVSENSNQTLSGKRKRAAEGIRVITNVHHDLFDTRTDKAEDGMYPFSQLEPGQGFFVPAKDGQTTDNLIENMYRTIHHVRETFAEVQRDENGDEILDNVTVKTRKKNDDGTFQLTGDNEVITGANFTHMPRAIYTRNFVAKPVTKDSKLGDSFNAPEDGIIVIRVW